MDTQYIQVNMLKKGERFKLHPGDERVFIRRDYILLKTNTPARRWISRKRGNCWPERRKSSRFRSQKDKKQNERRIQIFQGPARLVDPVQLRLYINTLYTWQRNPKKALSAGRRKTRQKNQPPVFWM